MVSAEYIQARQVDEKFKPDKEDTHTIPMNLAGWTRSHDSLRQELAVIQKVLEKLRSKKSLRDDQKKKLQSAWNVHKQHMHEHHHNEDDIYFPEMSKRYMVPKNMSEDHVGLNKRMDDMEPLFSSLTDITKLYKQWLEYHKYLEKHFIFAEIHGLPLSRAYFTEKELKDIEKQFVEKTPPLLAGSFLFWQGLEVSDLPKKPEVPPQPWFACFSGPPSVDFEMPGYAGSVKKGVDDFMVQEGIPWFVYYLVFKGGLEEYIRVFARPISELLLAD